MYNSIRPMVALHALTKDYPSLGRWLNSFWRDRGKSLPDWPPYVLLPMAGWYAIASDRFAAGKELTILQGSEVSRLAAIGAWRYSQGIYRIAPELMTALLESPVMGNIPTDVLHHLPEWSVYIETPGMSWREKSLHGFWAHLEWDVNDGREELRLLLDADSGLLPYPLHLGGDLSEALKGFLAEARRHGVVSGKDEAEIHSDADGLSRLLSLVLYLCTDAPEIDDSCHPGNSPHRPQPKRVKGGWKLFPPLAPRVWSVGRETAVRLREAAQNSAGTQDAAGRTVRAHLRRGHWHGYWTGPKKSDTPQKLCLRWLHPFIVGGEKNFPGKD